MPDVVHSNLAGFTVNYNGIQFGGVDASYNSLPPMYSLRARPRWDRSGRTIELVDVELAVSAVFFATGEAAMGSSMRSVRLALLTPGKTLVLSGLGSGFDTIANPPGANPGDTIDLNNGPKPTHLEMNSLGQLAWEIKWGCTFSILPCVGSGGGTGALSFTSFNFTTSWRNDFEGYTARIIQGSVSIPSVPLSASPKTVLHIADETRGSIIIDVPTNFKRVENSWSESEDKRTLNFSIVDQQLEGDPYPAGITEANGSFNFVSGGSVEKASMSQALGTLTMTLKTAYNQPRNLAGRIFIAAALSKQADIQTALNNAHAAQPSSVPEGSIIPVSFQISNGRYDGARITQASISWLLTQTFNTLLSACGIFDSVRLDNLTPPLAGGYTEWKATMSQAWNNRGVTGYTESVNEANIIDLCSNTSSKTIGIVGSSPNSPGNLTAQSLTCPDVPANGGWLHFDLDIRVHREDPSSLHATASSYLPSIGQVAYDYQDQPTSGNGTAVQIGGPTYSPSGSDNHITEYHGNPRFYIGLTFAGLRYKNVAFMPEIASVNGMVVRLVKQDGGTPKQVMDSFGCPIWSVSGYRIYSVPGYIDKIKPVSSLTAADTSIPLDL